MVAMTRFRLGSIRWTEPLSDEPCSPVLVIQTEPNPVIAANEFGFTEMRRVTRLVRGLMRDKTPFLSLRTQRPPSPAVRLASESATALGIAAITLFDLTLIFIMLLPLQL